MFRYPPCLNSSDPLTESDLCDIEELAFAGDTAEHRAVQRLLIDIRRVRHQLSDPMFMYADGRISRHAILTRNAEIDRLRSRVVSANPPPDAG